MPRCHAGSILPTATRTLLDVLRERFPQSSARTLRQMLKGDRVRVNGAPERAARRPIEGSDRVEVSALPARPVDARVRILFEDDDLIVIDKAAGLLTVPSPVERRESAETFLNLYAGARSGERRVHHVHRLDRDASGVLVFAKSEHARDRLKSLFAAHEIARLYLAVVHGQLEEQDGTLRSFLAEGVDRRVRVVDDPAQGKEAITHYRVLACGRRYSLLEVTLETGRRHQIRVHLASAGHPVVGDAMYGRDRDDPLGRLGLHAKHLGFVHPRSGRQVAVTADAPPSFAELEL